MNEILNKKDEKKIYSILQYIETWAQNIKVTTADEMEYIVVISDEFKDSDNPDRMINVIDRLKKDYCISVVFILPSYIPIDKRDNVFIIPQEKKLGLLNIIDDVSLNKEKYSDRLQRYFEYDNSLHSPVYKEILYILNTDSGKKET
jgi:hypothetical protein